MAPKQRPAVFYPLLIITPMAAVCAILAIVGAAIGRFSWAFAIIWLVLVTVHVLNLLRLAARSNSGSGPTRS